MGVFKILTEKGKNKMATQKNKMALPLIVAAVVVAAGAGYFVMKPSAEKEEAQIAEMVEENATTPADSETAKEDEAAATPAAVETAAGTEAPADDNEIMVKQGNPVVARVDGMDIKRTDVYRFIQTMPQNVQQMPATTVYPMAVEQVINTRLVQNLADKADIVDEDAFKAEMAIAKQQIARNLFLEKQVDDKITESKLKKIYADFIKQVPTVEERRARHILVDSEEKAKAVIEKLKKGGDFAALAKELSAGPTAPKGGDLGYFAKTEMVPEFANAAFGMEKNSTLETPVKTQFGWHVIKVEDIRERAKPTYEQVLPNLQAEARREVLEELLTKWRKEAKIEQFDINGDALKKGANATGLVPPAEEKATN